MIREIIKDQFILSQTSVDATSHDLSLANDLLDTLHVHRDQCVGMAANMIGELKRIIVFQDGKDDVIMINPIIIKKSKSYLCDEGCLCHVGVKEVRRFKFIKVEYVDQKFRKRVKSFSDFTAQIIQHEIDHLNGILI